MAGSIRHWKLISQSINNTINQAQWGTQEMRILPPAKHTHTRDGAQQLFSSGHRRMVCRRGRYPCRGTTGESTAGWPRKIPEASIRAAAAEVETAPKQDPQTQHPSSPCSFLPHTQSSDLTAYPRRFSKDNSKSFSKASQSNNQEHANLCKDTSSIVTWKRPP